VQATFLKLFYTVSMSPVYSVPPTIYKVKIPIFATFLCRLQKGTVPQPKGILQTKTILFSCSYAAVSGR